MRALQALSLSLLFTACSGSEPTTPLTPTDGGPTLTDTETGTTLLDSGWPVGDIGNLHVAYHVNSGRTEAMGLFLDSSAGFLNMAQCTLFDQAACYSAMPPLEDFEDINTDQRVDPEVVRSRYLGFEIEFGPYILPYQEDPRTGLGFYALDVTNQGFPEGEIGAKWGGQWEPRRSRDDLVVSPPIELTSPRPGADVFVANGTRLPIEWVPTGEGEITIAVANRFTVHRLFHVIDDGYFELDVDQLGLFGQLENVSVTVMRWNIAEVQWTGHYTRMVASSDAVFGLEIANVGARDELFVVDECNEALGMPALTTGDYWGNLDGYDPLLNPANFYPNCLQNTGNWYANANGRDGIVRVELPPRSVVNVEYTHFSESGSLYFVSSCASANTCEIGIDADVSPGANEVLNLANKTDDLETWFLILDSTTDESNDSEVFTLDATIEPLLDPEMYDLCVDAEAAAVTLTTGSYYEEFVAYTGDLNPGIGGCTNSSTGSPGAEAVMPFVLQPNETITATVDMEAGNASVYILDTCDMFSCVAGSDVSLTDLELVQFQNTSGGPMELNLVVDSSNTGLRPFLLGVTIQ